MHKFISSIFYKGMKGYKVQGVERQTRVGIAAKNLKDLIQKGKQKLKIADDEEISVVTEDDGTLIDSDDFLQSLPPQSALVFLRNGESWNGAGELVYHALSMLYNTPKKSELAEEIRQLMVDETAPEKINMFSQYLDMLETDIEAEERFEHEDWFDGASKKCKTKGDVMRNSAQSRIRSYYNSAKDQIDKESSPHVKALLTQLLEAINKKLKSNDFHGHYFDRSAGAKQRMCDKQGWFRCKGAFDQSKCSKLHLINPYASKGHRQLFSLWNLDHVIEKSREVIPKLIEAAKKSKKVDNLKMEEVYRLLFTDSNLKLVHIICHKKAARPLHTIDVASLCVS